MATILLLSGPNLNLLGPASRTSTGRTRSTTAWTTRGAAVAAGYELEHFQSNHEGDLIDQIHAARGAPRRS